MAADLHFRCFYAGNYREASSRNIADPAGDGGVAPRSGDHRRGGKSQHHRDRMITTLTRPAITHLPSSSSRSPHTGATGGVGNNGVMSRKRGCCCWSRH